ncbi:DUF5011 domain-containing protein [Hyalangium minutum]|uniref:DUF5011 domain-containing protein n=1 Tax=Hyalangium minutum TaxID=394096 RepID=UPI0006949F24|nr:DUF5011 domain-containing protein [Hyalangium minutum]
MDPIPYPRPFYRITVESSVLAPTCTVQPKSLELTTSRALPQVAIQASADGIVAAYTYGEFVRFMGDITRVSVRNLDPNTLGTLRGAGLSSAIVPPNGAAGYPGAVLLDALTIQGPYVEVSGTFTGNALTEDPATIPWPYPIWQGNNFVASYANFFTTTTPPILGAQACASLPPVLTVNGGSPLTLECVKGGTYSDPGAQAVDGCGNPLVVHAYNTGTDSSGPGPLLSYEGSYPVSYSTWNHAGSVDVTRTVIVDDTTAPSLTLLGSASIVHTCNTPWTDPGVTATDACSGNITPWVSRTGEVNAWAVGVYTLTYNVTDGGGNSATPVTRTVQVVNCPW